MRLLILFLGLVILLFGRKIFWLFIGIVGFLAGIEITDFILAGRPGWEILLVALVFGVIGALLAVFVERVAFALAGFYAGAYISLILSAPFEAFGSHALILIAGGVIGAIASILLMDWAIIGLSCLIGAGTIVNQLPIDQTIRAIVFVVLVIVGASAQARFMDSLHRK
jgi:hypothetical protein